MNWRAMEKSSGEVMGKYKTAIASPLTMGKSLRNLYAAARGAESRSGLAGNFLFQKIRGVPVCEERQFFLGNVHDSHQVFGDGLSEKVLQTKDPGWRARPRREAESLADKSRPYPWKNPSAMGTTPVAVVSLVMSEWR